MPLDEKRHFPQCPSLYMAWIATRPKKVVFFRGFEPFLTPDFALFCIGKYHKQRWTEPKYIEVDRVGPDHKRFFVMTVKDINGKEVGRGKGSSKKRGEQEASREALIHYGELGGDSDSSSSEESSSEEESSDDET